jgi:hypothetical protein
MARAVRREADENWGRKRNNRTRVPNSLVHKAAMESLVFRAIFDTLNKAVYQRTMPARVE